MEKKRKIKILENEPLSEHSTFKIGGPARYFTEVFSTEEMLLAIRTAKKLKVKPMIIGWGSNVLFPDKGLNALVIKNAGGEMSFGGTFCICDAGVDFAELIEKSVAKGLQGLEMLSGIPGTVGGAVCGNAGAYGHTISEVVESVFVFDGKSIKEISKKNCGFDYRDTVFKKKNWVILGARFGFKKGKKSELLKHAENIKNIRMAKYPHTLKCAGSFFKNVLVSKAPKKFMFMIDPSKILEGKVPVGYLLESAGAKGLRQGGAKVADFHSNFILNDGNATAKDVATLAGKMKSLVKQKYGISIESEVRML